MADGNHKFREEVVNVQLATILASKGLDANAETVVRGRLPDILINLEGIKLMLEGRTSSQQASLMRDARKRIEEGLADISMAIVYPEGLGYASSMAQLKAQIESSRYLGTVFYLDSIGLASVPFADASLDEIVQTINTVYRLRIQNDIVRDQVKNLDDTIERVVQQASLNNLFFNSEALVTRLKHALGIDANARTKGTGSDSDADED